MRGCLRFLAIVALFGMAGATAEALTLYADSAGSNRIDLIDPNTGTLIRSCNPGKGNGRGMVVVSNIGYFTVANSNNVYQLDINTCADLGIAFSVAGASGLSTIAYDGTNFWIGDYSGTNKAYYYTISGTLIKTITLSNCTSFCDGLEYFNGKLISNRGDNINAPYDVYDLNGTLLQAAFITPNFQATGIAYDGTNFYISNPTGGTIGVFNGTTGAFIRTLTLNGGTGFLIEDLSFDYQQVLPTPTPQGTVSPTVTPTRSPVAAVVPTLGFPMLALFGAALVGAALLLMRR